MILWIWITVVLALVWTWYKRKYSKFAKGGVSYKTPLPFIGNIGPAFMKKKHMAHLIDGLYQSFPGERFFGSFEFTNASIFLKDSELIRQIGVKDFDHFVNHISMGNENDAFFSKSLIGLKGDRWRDMRSTLSPAFTASKLKKMMPLIMETNNDVFDSLQTQLESIADNYLDIDIYDLLTRYTTDVIATCAFGLKTNSVKERDNKFYEMGKRIITFNSMQFFKIFMTIAFPFLKKIIQFEIFDTDAIKYLQNVVLGTMHLRDEEKIFRPDMIQILLEVKKGTLKYENENNDKAGFATVEESSIGKHETKQAWMDEDLAAQALLFFFAGYETVSSGMVFLMLELAVNTEVQQKLREEIDEHHKNNQKKVDFDTLQHMKYMDMVISESLRKWPPAIVTDRACLKKYSLGRPNNNSVKEFIIEPGQAVNIPIWSIHHDPENYRNPEQFDPDRFSEENKVNIKPFTYLPFGVGPRNCIGSRLALMEIKAMVYELLRRFELSPAPETVIPLRYDNNEPFRPRPAGGARLRIKTRVY